MKENESLIKDENEAIEAIKSNMPTSGYYMLRQSLEMAIKALEDVQEYQKIGTVEEVRELKERDKALLLEDIMANRKDSGRLRFGTCPKCKTRVSNVEGGNFCQNCGQRLKWEE